MNTCKIEKESIERLKDEWEEFHSRCIAQVDSQLSQDWQDAENEAAQDLRDEKYTEESVNSWIRNQKNGFSLWGSGFKRDIDNKYDAGVKLIEQLEQKKFSERDYGNEFIVKFNSEEIEVLKTGQSGFRVSVCGMMWNIDGVSVEFYPSCIEYTDWEEESDNENSR